MVPWVIYDVEHAPYLRVTRPDSSEHRFDLAGHFVGGDLHQTKLYAEVKKYSSDGDQATLYRKYAADCYFALLFHGLDYPLQFLWITWHPFSQTTWTRLCGDALFVREAVSSHVEHLAGIAIDDAVCQSVAERLWVIVLCDKQESALVPSPEMVGQIRAIEIQRALS